eukprot:CAMPEP_0167783328 /NCGR_PEP_ID=MMETSP0111_2-20121227/7009_1 /TAXON_ID=91324 /ORGANISM="Lotharella globosa, Strain CCCM811" /LENGTH=185 /DNA_ID=CAMNT_0007674253 /DNA_START=28 /DNA_END=582 /DNA_ORIENTATION=+
MESPRCSVLEDFPSRRSWDAFSSRGLDIEASKPSHLEFDLERSKPDSSMQSSESEWQPTRLTEKIRSDESGNSTEWPLSVISKKNIEVCEATTWPATKMTTETPSDEAVCGDRDQQAQADDEMHEIKQSYMAFSPREFFKDPCRTEEESAWTDPAEDEPIWSIMSMNTHRGFVAVRSRCKADKSS